MLTLKERGKHVKSGTNVVAVSSLLFPSVEIVSGVTQPVKGARSEFRILDSAPTLLRPPYLLLTAYTYLRP